MIQIEFLKKFQDEQRSNHLAEVSTLEGKADVHIQEIATLTSNLQKAQDEITSMHSGKQSDQSSVQKQMDEFKQKLDKKRIKTKVLKQE